MIRDTTVSRPPAVIRRCALVAALWAMAAPEVPAADAPPDESGGAPDPWEQYRADRSKSILELQPFREIERAQAPSGRPVRLIALNPHSNAWFVLEVGDDTGSRYHIENADPRTRTVRLAAEPSAALLISGKNADERCAPWEGDPAPLESARASGLPYAPLCDGRLYLRNPVPGSRTTLERVTDYLRDHVWKGEQIVGFVRDAFFQDAFRASGEEVPAGPAARQSAGPTPAMIDPAFSDQAVVPDRLGLGLEGAPSGRMALGRWYPVAGLPGIHASAIQPKAISEQVRHGAGQANALDSVEAGAVDFMVAFDLSHFALRFALGTDHPRLDWSPRPPASVRNDKLPGPDGVGTAEPLARVGMVRPDLVTRTAAAFTGGFKRQHGAFKWGELSTRNRGSHYGFIEQGVIFSKLQPGLATLLVFDDGSVEMRTWTEQDDGLLPRIRFARQNGVALLGPGPGGGPGVPGNLVTQWGPGNWSGSADARLRTLRAGACLQASGDSRYLIYGYFSTATPSAMARTFQAYGCRYAMLLDMNALEHTYLALYQRRNDELRFEHLITGMSEVDRTGPDGEPIPRFIGFPDNRDFFYLTRKPDSP